MSSPKEGEDGKAGEGHIPNRIFHRTIMCKYFMRRSCRKGDACTYAHSLDEMQPLPNLKCTKWCPRLLQTGVCGVRGCTFAHRAEELRGRLPVPHPGEELELPNYAPAALQVQQGDRRQRTRKEKGRNSLEEQTPAPQQLQQQVQQQEQRYLPPAPQEQQQQQRYFIAPPSSFADGGQPAEQPRPQPAQLTYVPAAQLPQTSCRQAQQPPFGMWGPGDNSPITSRPVPVAPSSRSMEAWVEESASAPTMHQQPRWQPPPLGGFDHREDSTIAMTRAEAAAASMPGATARRTESAASSFPSTSSTGAGTVVHNLGAALPKHGPQQAVGQLEPLREREHETDSRSNSSKESGALGGAAQSSTGADGLATCSGSFETAAYASNAYGSKAVPTDKSLPPYELREPAIPTDKSLPPFSFMQQCTGPTMAATQESLASFTMGDPEPSSFREAAENSMTSAFAGFTMANPEWASFRETAEDSVRLGNIMMLANEETGGHDPAELCVRNTFLSLEPKTVLRRTNSAPGSISP